MRTEQAYVGWIRRFILFYRKRHPQEMGAEEVTAFLSHLAVHGGVASATQNQALSSALLFLYKEVLRQDLPWLSNVEHARKPRRLPTVLTVDETGRLLDRLKGTLALMARLQYGSGMRLMECVRLRVFAVERRGQFLQGGNLSTERR
ncbi:MAG: phage integrase N-terminal SAM-like domain-containing protein [Gallionellaceae bacterium]